MKRTSYFLAAILLSAVVVHAQQLDQAPFAAVERTASEEHQWAGNKERISAVFATERIRLGSQFESELLKWLGNDVERHYWISLFLEHDGYLHGNERLPELSLLIKQQGLSLVQRKSDKLSKGHIVKLSITAAVLAEELQLRQLARAYKSEAEGLLLSDPDLSVYVPGLSESDRRRYDEIGSPVNPTRTIVGIGSGRMADVASTNPPPKAPIMGGVLNGKAIRLPKPSYPKAARDAHISGPVEVRVVIDETGKVVWVQAVSGHAELRKSCEEAAWQTEFSPTKLSGQPVKVSGTILYNFVAR